MRNSLAAAFALALVACTSEASSPDAGFDGGSDAPELVSDDAASFDAFRPTPDAARPDAGPVLMDPILPTVMGPCGDFNTSGTVTLHGPGGTTRTANLWVSEAARTLDGPFVFYWHGAGGSPLEAPGVLGPAQAEILAQGGIVVALTHDPAAGSLPWFLSSGSDQNDLVFADEALACAVQEIGIDTRHIHSVGFSAGALHTSQMAFYRAGYLASVVTYSGGIILRAPATNPLNARTAVMALHGGPRDIVVISFADATARLVTALRRDGHFAFVCNHGGGHTVPPAARASAWQFLEAHPYGAQPPAYAAGLPAGFYAPCTLD